MGAEETNGRTDGRTDRRTDGRRRPWLPGWLVQEVQPCFKTTPTSSDASTAQTLLQAAMVASMNTRLGATHWLRQAGRQAGRRAGRQAGGRAGRRAGGRASGQTASIARWLHATQEKLKTKTHTFPCNLACPTAFCSAAFFFLHRAVW